MERSEALKILESLRLEFERKGEEVWSRGLEYGYESATNGFEKAAKALEIAVKALSAEADAN